MKTLILTLVLLLSFCNVSERVAPGTYILFNPIHTNSNQNIEITFNKDSTYIETVFNFGDSTDMRQTGKWHQNQDTMFYTINTICFSNRSPSCTTYVTPITGFYYFVDAIKDTQFYFESGYLQSMQITNAKHFYKNQKYRDIHLCAIKPKDDLKTISK
jgi:hypothetical protein